MNSYTCYTQAKKSKSSAQKKNFRIKDGLPKEFETYTYRSSAFFYDPAKAMWLPKEFETYTYRRPDKPKLNARNPTLKKNKDYKTCYFRKILKSFWKWFLAH